MTNPLLELKNITMKFGGVTAIDSLSLHINKNEVVALIGPNGAGKTTAFNVMTGVYAPTEGVVFLDGKTMTSASKGASPDKVTKLGVARTFQNIRLFKKLSVFDNILIGTHMNSKANFLSAMLRLNINEERKSRKESMNLLEMVGLVDLKDEIASSLPYGKQRRLEIARALATKPNILLLDEPAAGMNPQETDELTEFIKKIKKDFTLTVLMIEHHMNMVMEISDRIYVLDFGKLIASGSPSEIQNDKKVINAYLGGGD